MSAGFHSGRKRKWRTFWKAILLEYYPAAVTIFVGTVLALVLTGGVARRLQPLLRAAAGTQAENRIVSIMERTVLAELERLRLDYADLVCVDRMQDGSITAITTDMAALNRLRGALLERLMPELMEIDRKDIAVPVGSLLDSELLWGRGPTIKIRSLVVGSLRAEFESEFTAAGGNQTLHKIWLTLLAPATVLLPGDQLEMEVRTRLCVAETVIVGEVPNDIQRYMVEKYGHPDLVY